ncbi:ABC transporter substrate-binding protein [Hyphococcus sp. DH-69]|uniref:ABC transporter substrate-binding protein n=1 Tax=Hyphococcus formosus TaxID=3143534 RepID=UPI00398B8F0F
MIRRVSALGFFLALAVLKTADAKPDAVSLDYCADQYVLKLADDDQILAVSRGADKDYSYMRIAAKKHSRVRPTREEVFALEPQIVIRQWGGGANAEAAFSAFGAEVITLRPASSFDDVIDNIRMVATALEQTDRGEEVIKNLRARLALIEHEKNVSALYVTPGGVTAGSGTMIDAIIAAAGARNKTAERGLHYYPPLSAEALLLDPPEFIVAGFFQSRDEGINHWSAARHPAITSTIETIPHVSLSPDLISCPAWFAVEASEKIADAIAEHSP